MTLPALPRPLEARAVRPGDRRYRLLRSTYTTHRSPALVLLPESDDEVAQALVWAAGTGLPLSVRSGGHGLAGRSSNDGGIVVDLSVMHRVEVVAGTRVRVQAGARWAQVAKALAPHGLAISSGDHGNMGVGGLATAGGVGWLVRSFGLTLDRVRAATLVTPDGTVHHVDAEHEPELLWVVRGAADAVGVVTELEIDAMPLAGIGVAQVLLEADAQGKTLRRWSEHLATAPRELTTAGMLAADGGHLMLQLTAVVADDDPEHVRALVEPLTGLGTRALRAQAQLMTYPDMVPTAHLHPNMGQQRSSTTNALLPVLGDDEAAALVDAARHPAGAFVQLRSLGGATTDLAPEETAWAHRHQQVLAVVSTFPPDDGTGLDAAAAPLLAVADGAYRNFDSRPTDATWARAFPGETGEHVRALADEHDPDGVLRRWSPQRA
jgi:FAD/FMN-containing dehydrogenase